MISEGPEALQKYIDSGAIEELHDVMPIKDDDDDEDYLNDYNDDDKSNPSNSHIPSLLSQPMCKPTDVDREGYANNCGDSDRRTFSDLDFRPPPSDPDFRYNMHPDMDDDYYGDGDYRGNEPDYRPYDDEDDYYDDGRNWPRNGGPYGNFGPSRSYGGFGQPNFRQGNSYSRNDTNGSQGDGGWGSPGQGGDSFRSRSSNPRRNIPSRGARGNRGPNRNMRGRSGGSRGGSRGRY